jgi:hypothetical protein
VRKYLAATVLAAAAAATAACSGTTAGTETIKGTSTNVRSGVIPLTASGLVSTTGSFNADAPGNAGTLRFRDGDLRVYHSNGSVKPFGSAASCTGGETVTGSWHAVSGSTGTWKGAAGSGKFTVYFEGRFRPPDGRKCTLAYMNANSTVPVSGIEKFTATGSITIK